MVKKTRLWRKTISDVQYTKNAVENLKALSSTGPVYTHDVLGDVGKSDSPYPEKFAKEKFPATLSRSDHFKIKNLPVKRPRADQSQIFDMWEEENEGKNTEYSHIPSVINPHPGQSYRPDKLHHEDILEDIIKEEQVKETDIDKHEQVLNSYRVIEEDHSPVESEDDEPGNFLTNRRVVEKYMTNTQKNVKKRNQLKEKLKKILSAERKTQKQIEKIPHITQELERLDKKYLKLREEKNINQQIKIELEKTGEIVPKIRMGKFRYKKPESQASINPSDSLRKMAVKGNSVEERMDSFIRRQMVDLYKSKDKKKVVVKDCSNNERAIEFQLARAKKQAERETGNIALNK